MAMRLLYCLCSLLFLSRENLVRGGDPTDGFTSVQLSEQNFELQKPYNKPLSQRYSYVDGVRRFWVYSNDKPLRSNSTTKPRTEVRMRGLDYSSGVWQFEGHAYVPRGASAVSIMQIHGIIEAATCVQLRMYNGDLWFFNHSKLAKKLYDKWFRVNVIHEVDKRKLIVFINGYKRYETKDHGPGEFYFKFGVYAQKGASHYMESRWKNIKIYAK